MNNHCHFSMNGGAALANNTAMLLALRDHIPFTLLRSGWLYESYPAYIRGYSLYLV